MNEQSSDNRAGLRKTVYAILIAVGIGAVLGRILAVDAVEETRLQEYRARLIPRQLAEKRARLVEQGAPEAAIARELQRTEASLRRDVGIQRPFLSANDRSRWCTLRALVEPEMRVAAEVGTDKNGSRGTNGSGTRSTKCSPSPAGKPSTWSNTRCRRTEPAAREYLYSSKPPLLPTLMVLPYWVIYMATGATLGSHPYEIGRALLILYNAVPLLVYFLLLARLIERFGKSDWGRIFTMAAAVFGTFLTTFAVVLNNHLPGAISALVALYACVRIWFDQERRLRYFVVAGLFGAFVVACELPGLAFACAIGAALFWKAPKQTLAGFVPAAARGGRRILRHQLGNPPDLQPAYMNPAWYDYQYKLPPRRPAGQAELLAASRRHRPGRAVRIDLCGARARGAPRHLLAVADLDSLARRARSLADSPGRSPAPPSGRADHRGVRGLPGLLFVHAAAGKSQLRRHDGGPPLGVLVCPDVARGNVAGGRPMRRKNLGPPDRAGTLGGLYPLGNVPDVEPVDASLALQFHALHGLDRSVRDRVVLSFREIPRLAV